MSSFIEIDKGDDVIQSIGRTGRLGHAFGHSTAMGLADESFGADAGGRTAPFRTWNPHLRWIARLLTVQSHRTAIC